MNEREQHQLAARPRALDRVIDDLLSWIERIRAGEPLRWPRCTLHFASGGTLAGTLLATADDRGTQLLVAAGDDLSYVPCASVVAITVHDAHELGTAAPGAPPPPSRLEVSRALAGALARLAEERGISLAGALADDLLPAALSSALPLVRTVVDALAACASDDDGRAALGQKVRGLLVAGPSAAAPVALLDGRLVVRVAAGPRDHLSADGLRAAIERLL